ncbi:MAG: type II toxin-antitoxin system VapB family antitoxin [Akkermansiaceae bacterium]|jgi:Arc/MetJ family transcription regulator|nr:type II toxin-antitoxin system VapB family antitoxin [Akkermansiaceae bacterium]MBJ7425212.1 type II toxin-antitoxin system VapB family antitoxin [Akkermansiaceae bacterium]
MKTTIDIPDTALADAMRFTGAKTKREAVVKALESYNRQQRVRCAGFRLRDTPRGGIAGTGSSFRNDRQSHAKMSGYAKIKVSDK